MPNVEGCATKILAFAYLTAPRGTPTIYKGVQARSLFVGRNERFVLSPMEWAMTPTRAEQQDLFALDSPLYGDVPGERSIAAFPFFALTKVAHMKPIEYSMPNIKIEVRPSTKGGTTIDDKEVVYILRR